MIISLANSQTRLTLQPEKTYSLAKIYKKSNQIVKGRNLSLMNDSTLSYKNSNFQDETISIYDLRSLKIKTGNKALAYGAYGGGLMALSSLYAYLQVQSDPYRELKPNAGAIFTGFIIGGAAVGALIGMASPKWSNVSLPKKKPQGTSMRIQPVIGGNKNYMVNMSFKF